MVRGNWQRRVEKTEARRAANKARKQKHSDRASHKLMVSNLLTQLDTNNTRRIMTTIGDGTRIVLHVWTDSMPDGSVPIVDNVDEDEEDDEQHERGNKRRGRSGSFHKNEAPPQPRKPYAEKKKPHPRSHRDVENEPDASTTDPTHDSLLCRDQFFKGHCKRNAKKQGGGKKSSSALACRNVHYTKRMHKTLAQVLPSKTDTLLAAEAAIVDAAAETSDAGGIELLYYMPIELSADDFDASAVADSKEEERPSVGVVVSKALSDKACNNASIVYVALNNYLIFDRYQGGVLEEELALLFGGRLRSTSVISEASEEPGKLRGDQEGFESVPAPVLEYILMFLPDISVSTMSRVCRSWNKEIGTSSPNLWRQLLERREWPFPPQFTTDTKLELVKDTFTSHYEAVRNVRAIKDALSGIMNPHHRKGVIAEDEMVYQNFAIRRNAPAAPNACVAVEVWSSNKMVAAYTHDCTVRLFKTIEKGPDGGKACRELVSVCMDPYVKTKRQNSELTAMALDDDMIGSLLQVESYESGAESGVKTYLLCVVSRNDYLEAAGDENALGWSELDEDALNVIDVGEAVVNFLVSTDEMDHSLLRLNDFLHHGGEMEEVEVLVSPSIVACGQGRFLVEVTVSIPDLEASDDDDEEDEPQTMIMLGRKLAIFSATDDAIVWMGDSNPTESVIPRQRAMRLYGIRHGTVGSRVGSSVVAVTPSSPTILLAEIDPSGFAHSIRQVEAAEIVRAEILSSNTEWQVDTERQRPAALTQADILVCDVLFKDRMGDGSRDQKSVVSFYPRFVDNDEISYQTLVLEDTCVLHLASIQENHIVLVCEELKEDNRALEEGGDGGLVPDERSVALTAVVVHVPTRQVVDRVGLPYDPSFHEELETGRQPLVFSSYSSSSMLCVGIWWKGVVMTGSDVRSVGHETSGDSKFESPSNKSKRKKKKQARQRDKKDGFARGIRY